MLKLILILSFFTIHWQLINARDLYKRDLTDSSGNQWTPPQPFTAPLAEVYQTSYKGSTTVKHNEVVSEELKSAESKKPTVSKAITFARRNCRCVTNNRCAKHNNC